MRDKRTITLKERQAREREAEAKILRTLSDSNPRLDSLKEAKRQKKKSLGELLRLTDFIGIEGFELRPIDAYVPRSYNLEKQVYGLIDHLYVRYRVPGFLYRACLARPYDAKPGGPPASVIDARRDPFLNMHWDYRQWFVTLAQGGSFQKKVKGIMTSREATVFLKAPSDNLIHENVWWARLTVAGILDPVRTFLLRNILSQYYFTDEDGRLREVVLFFAANHGEMNKSTMAEITDFLRWKLANDPTFRMKGRTLGSVIRLSNEWHVQMQKAKLGSVVVWPGWATSDWQIVAEKLVWQAVQLRSNRDLLTEGRKQRHCVYGYVQQCIAGRSHIFSIRCAFKAFSHYDQDGNVVWTSADELTRLTVEVNARGVIVQVRGALNRVATPEEWKVVRRWAGEKGFTLN